MQMAPPRTQSRFLPPLAIAACASVLSHALILLAAQLALPAMDRLMQRATLAAQALRADERPPVALGEDRPSPVRVVWLGVAEEASEHSAPRSTTTQAQLDLASRQQTSEQTPDTQAPPAEDGEPAMATPLEPGASTRTLAKLPSELLDAARTALEAAQAGLKALAHAVPAEPMSQSEPMDQQREPAQAIAPAAATPRPGSAPPTTSDEGPGSDDRQADATSTSDVLQWRPGRPIAAEGLRITTRRPVWSDATRASAAPRNPVVELAFGHDGRIVRHGVRFVGGGTGYDDVDRPLIDAIYLWRASGQRIDALDRGRTVTLRLRVMLR